MTKHKKAKRLAEIMKDTDPSSDYCKQAPVTFTTQFGHVHSCLFT